MKLLQKILLAACVFTAFAPVAHAEKFFGSSSVSLLYSDDYEIFGSQKESATVFTWVSGRLKMYIWQPSMSSMVG